MVRTIRVPVAHDRVGEPSAGPLRRVQGLAGVAILTLAATTLGLPLSGGHLATDLLLIILGYKVTTKLRQGQYEDRNVLRFWLGHLGRVGVPLLVALGLTVTYWSWSGVVTAAQRQAVIGALTFNHSFMDGIGGTHVEAVEHLGLVTLISLFVLVLPVVLFVCRGLKPIRRAVLLFILATMATLARVTMATTGTTVMDGDLLFGLLRVDGLLFGAAIAVTPLPLLRRLMPANLAGPLFFGLLLAFVAAPGGPIAAGIVAGPAAWITMVLSTALVSAAAGGGLSGPLSVVVDSQHSRWLGARTLSILIWHQLIGYIFLDVGSTAGATGAEAVTAVDQWPGLLVFAVRLVFTLAAAAISHRYLELPLGNLARQHTGPRGTHPALQHAAATTAPASLESVPMAAPIRQYVPASRPPEPVAVATLPRTKPEPPLPAVAREVNIPSAVTINHPTMRPLRLSREAHPSMSGRRRLRRSA
ncbi:MAG: hypothetical protein AAGA65_04410 [Actinomycetota bacterium]